MDVMTREPGSAAQPWGKLFRLIAVLLVIPLIALALIVRTQRTWQQAAAPIYAGGNVRAIAFSEGGDLVLAYDSFCRRLARTSVNCFTQVEEYKPPGLTESFSDHITYGAARVKKDGRMCAEAFEVQSGKEIGIDCEAGARAVAISPSGRFLGSVSGADNGSLRIFDLTDKKPLGSVPIQLGTTTQLTFSDDDCVAVLQGIKIRQFCGLGKGTIVPAKPLTLQAESVESFGFGFNGKLIGIIDSGSRLYVYDQGVRRASMQADDYGSSIRSMAFSPDGDTLALSRGQKIEFWHWRKYDYARQLFSRAPLQSCEPH
jgi:WD40 repeat protein